MRDLRCRLQPTVACLCALALFPLLAHAAPHRPPPPERGVEIVVGTAQAQRIAGSIDKVIVGDPAICDVVALPPTQLLFVGKAPGETLVTVWSREAGVSAIRVMVGLPILALQTSLREAFPSEEDLTIRASGASVFIGGRVSSARVADQALRMANAHFATLGQKPGEIINLISVAGVQQVQLHVKFIEISRTLLRQMGFSAWARRDTASGGSFAPNTTNPTYYDQVSTTENWPSPNYPAGPANADGTFSPLRLMPIITSPIAGTFNLAFASSARLPISATLAVMEQHGLTKVLSEPTLVATSGQEARFHVGGKFPVPVPSGLATVTIVWQDYGVDVRFKPTVAAQDELDLQLDATVSELDRLNSTQIQGTVVPGLITRNSSTSVRLRDAQSFAIAGLLNEQTASTINKVPILGDLPLIGSAFRTVYNKRTEQELVVLVSSKLVKPQDGPDVPPMPNEDEFVSPTDLELFLLGVGERGNNAAPAAAAPRDGRRAAPAGAVGFSR